MKGGWNAAIDALWWLPDAGLHFANRWLVRPETLAARHRPQGRESSVSSSLIVSTDVNVAFNGSKVLLGSWAEVPFEVARERLAGAMKTLVALGIFWIECSGPRHNRNFVVASLSRKHACLAQAYYSTDVYIFLSSRVVPSSARVAKSDIATRAAGGRSRTTCPVVPCGEASHAGVWALGGPASSRLGHTWLPCTGSPLAWEGMHRG